MSVLVSSIPSPTSAHLPYFSNGNITQTTKHMPIINRSMPKLHSDGDNDHVPFGVVNSMKQRLLDKVNESLLLNNHSTLIRHSLSKSSTRLSSNESLLQTKPIASPLKRTTRLSRSQDSLLNNAAHAEPFTSYLQPKQDVVIVDATASSEENVANHRHSYTELHVDEVPKPGTVITVKNMFERQIRLSRFDSDKLSNTSAATSSRVNSHHQREVPSPNRSRSISPNDMALRQRRAVNAPTALSLPLPIPYPDVVISHTPPIPAHVEVGKPSHEQSTNSTQNENKKKEVPVNETSVLTSDLGRPNLLLPSSSSSDILDYQPLDFKSRLALFNQTTASERSNEHPHPNSTIVKKVIAPPPPSFLTKPVVHHHHSERSEAPADDTVRSFVHTSKAVTFFGGTKLNEPTKSTLPESITPPPPPIVKEEQSAPLVPIDFLSAPDIVGGNVKLSKSSLFSGVKKDARVQFIDSVDTFEYPSFNIAMAEFGDATSETDDYDDEEEEDGVKIAPYIAKITDQMEDVNDDELESLARINAEFNSTNHKEKPLQPKGTLHTFRPTHLDQYELGTQHGGLGYSNSSDTLPRETYFSSLNNFTNHSSLRQQKSPFEMANSIQWSSMSTTTDLLF